jgi:Protein of unknown function (DUF2795)
VTERGSTHHSGRVDDVLAEEVEPLVRSGHEARATDDRLHEPPADDEPLPDARIAGEDTPTPGLLDLDEIEARSRLAASLRPRAFPADRDELRAVAEEQHAPPEVLEALDSLPAGIRFVNVQQVWESLGGDRERRDTGDAQLSAGGTAAVAPDIEPEDAAAFAEPIDAEIEVALELEGAEAREPVGDRFPPEPWWFGPARAGITLATLPLRVTAGVLRFVGERLRR